jgi:large subunit ribosomal protein L4e
MKKAIILDIEGKEKGKIDLPSCFSEDIREDLISKAIETKKKKQPYAPSLVAGKQHSASGLVVHRRHVWKSGYGRGASRVPRKIMSKRGSQFNWVGAEVSAMRGGRRAHPPKVISMINTKKINKKELKSALISAISATADEKEISKKYETLQNKKIGNLPKIVESKFTSLKTKDMLGSMKKVLGEDLFGIGIKKKSIRAGRGKLRGRKYKSNAGLLMVIGDKEKLKTNAFEVVNVKRLSVFNLAKGGPGRLTMYTDSAIKELGEKLK